MANETRAQQNPSSSLPLEITPSSFQPVAKEDRFWNHISRESITYWQEVGRKLKKNTVSMVALGVIVFLILFSFLGPFLVDYTYNQQIRGSENLRPMAYSAQELELKGAGEKVFPHIFGTDNLGRDIFVRIMYGTRISMSIGVVAALMVLVIGSIYGSIAGFIGGRVDMVMMRIAEIIYTVPEVLVVLLLATTMKPILDAYANTHKGTFLGNMVLALGPSIISIFIAFAALYWVTMARIVRGQVLQLKEQEFVLAAKALGATNARIITKHLLPNSVGAMVSATCLQIPSAIFLESFLSFLGLGVEAPMTSLGSMAADALGGVESFAYRLIIPSVVLSLLILSFNLFGDGLRDALDPRLED